MMWNPQQCCQGGGRVPSRQTRIRIRNLSVRRDSLHEMQEEGTCSPSCSEYSKIENDIQLGIHFVESMRSVQLSIWNNISPIPIAVNSSIFNFQNSNTWIAKNTSPCPKCAFRIKKNGGCNHGRCGNCSFNFCWICGEMESNAVRTYAGIEMSKPLQ